MNQRFCPENKYDFHWKLCEIVHSSLVLSYLNLAPFVVQTKTVMKQLTAFH